MKLSDRKIVVKADIQPVIESLWRRVMRRLEEWRMGRPYRGVAKLTAKVDKKIAKADQRDNGHINR